MKQCEKKILCAGLALSLFLTGCGSTLEKEASSKSADTQQPVQVTVWNYYNGQQLNAFDALAKEFNDTVGKEKGIVVEGHSQGSVNDLVKSVLDSVNRKAGASELPSIFAA